MLNTSTYTTGFPPLTTGKRCHQHSSTALWVESGTVQLQGSSVEAYRHDLLVIPSGVEHTVTTAPDSLVFPVFGMPTSIVEKPGASPALPCVHPLGHTWTVPILHGFLGWASPVRPVGNSRQPIFSSVAQIPDIFPEPVLSTSRLGSPICHDIKANPASSPSIEHFATLAGVSTRTLQRVFLHDTGLTVSQWRTAYRMSLATRLLLAGHDTTYIADHCGYDTTIGFARAFARTVGVPPGKWLSQHRGTGHATLPVTAPPVAPSFVANRRNTTFSVLLWMYRGTATVTVEDRTFRLRRGEAVWLPDHTTNAVHADANSLPMPLTCWPEELLDVGGAGFPGITSLHIPPYLEKPLMQHMVSAYTALKPTNPELTAQLRRELLSDLAELTDRQRVLGIGEPMVRPESGMKASTRTLKRVKDALRMLDEGMAASSIARKLGYGTASQFSRDVRLYAGAPPSSFMPVDSTACR
ncbi:MAG: helix-turn-helix domain-containing protein [Corynebacterium nuruki]|nr:helix-turn-helix domain-containing protein [Corynebacterium nuruki]